MTAAHHPSNNPPVAEEAREPFQQRVLGLQLRVWLIGVVVLVIGVVVGLVVWLINTLGAIGWSWPGWTVIGDLLTFLTLIAVVVALWFARGSARALPSA